MFLVKQHDRSQTLIRQCVISPLVKWCSSSYQSSSALCRTADTTLWNAVPIPVKPFFNSTVHLGCHLWSALASRWYNKYSIVFGSDDRCSHRVVFVWESDKMKSWLEKLNSWFFIMLVRCGRSGPLTIPFGNTNASGVSPFVRSASIFFVFLLCSAPRISLIVSSLPSTRWAHLTHVRFERPKHLPFPWRDTLASHYSFKPDRLLSCGHHTKSEDQIKV